MSTSGSAPGSPLPPHSVSATRLTRLTGFSALLAALLLVSSGPAPAASPKLVTIGQIGNALPDGRHYVLIYWQPTDGAAIAPEHAIHHKSGNPDSPNPYTRIAVVKPTEDIPTVGAILNRAAEAGFDIIELEQSIDAALGPDSPAGTPAAKLSRLLRGELPDEAAQFQLELMARTHPPVAMALGRAYLALVDASQPSTFELRQFDSIAGEEGAVVGRVTTGTAPLWLPPPDGLAESIELSPRGHLRVLLHWCTPAPLRSRSVHQNGFNLYRAHRQSWIDSEGAPPPLMLSRDLLLQHLQNGLIIPVNRLPILPPSDYECPSPQDAPHFFADDNDSAARRRHDPDGQPFASGDRYTYYVASRDFFGRPGDPSQGLDVTICDRMPPAVPKLLRVENQQTFDDNTETSSQHFSLSWQRDLTGDVTHYWIYRWERPQDALAHLDDPQFNLIYRLPNDGTDPRVSFEDDGTLELPAAPPRPTLPADAGRTWWFTIRAEDDTACPDDDGYGNLSGPSSPAFGVLRDWTGPDTPNGRLLVRCCRVDVTFEPEPDLDPPPEVIRLRGTRLHPRIHWVEFRELGHNWFSGRHEFTSGIDVVDLDFDTQGEFAFLFEARFGSHTGQTSPWVPGQTISAPPAPIQAWNAAWTCMETAPSACPGGVFDPLDPETGDILTPCGFVNPDDHSVEWRIYRRIGYDGQLTRITSGKFADTIEWCDPGLPPGGVNTLCYFVQTFDGDGNPSPIAPLGCIDVIGPEGLPKPVMKKATPAIGDPPGPDQVIMNTAWFCPRPGVDRFELALSPIPPESLRTILQIKLINGVPIPVPLGILESPRLPAGFGGIGPDFQTPLLLEPGVTYQAMVRAVGPGPSTNRASGAWSDPIQIRWAPTEDSGPLVPWPARPVPGVNPNIVLDAEYDSDETIGRVAIGTIPESAVQVPTVTPTLPPEIRTRDFEAFLDVPLPFVIYRHQSSENRRSEMTQISHFVEAFIIHSLEPGLINIPDKFISIKRPNGQTEGPYRIWFRDTQPLINGTSYRYTIVRHGEDREIVDVLPSNDVNVPVLLFVNPGP